MEPSRRAMLKALIAGPGILAARPPSATPQEPTAPDPSLYIPKAHLVEDRKLLHDFMDDFPFTDLVTAHPTLRITHIPALLDRTRGRFGTILGHISRQNPQHAIFDGMHTAVIVFRGPHGYISPSWYANHEVTPTWNFSVVHASGRPKAMTDPKDAYAFLARLIKKFESSVPSSTYDFSKLPESYVSGMMKGIAPFSMEIEALEGKFKLGQERSEGDRQGVLEHLQQGGYRERSLHDVTAAFYRSVAK